MLKSVVFSILIFCWLMPISGQGNNPATDKTGIGLTLSGGGAKGLAHIGVLHIIDSLGLEIDYVSGTSMGAVVGGLYAAGYSAKEIEEIALSLDWQDMFSRHSELGYTHPRRREFHGKYIVQLPIVNWSIVTPTGAIEGQQMWNALGRLFFHVRSVDDFNQLPIPFACVATDVSTGDAIVMQTGDIVTAIRASMALPSLFTTVEREGKELIDGGVVMNFPVKIAKEMGADKVIGVNVSQGLRKAEELQNPIDILYQMGFYMDARSFAENRIHADVFVEPDLKKYTAASFQSVEAIIEQGKRAARLNIDKLLKLKEETRTGYSYEVTHSDLRKIHEFVADTFEFEGLNNVRTWFVRNAISIQKGDTLNKQKLTSVVNRLYATDYFNRVTYRFLPGENNINGNLIFSFEEKPFGSVGAAIHYNNFSGVGLIGNLTTNKFLFYNTGAYLKALIGEQPALRGGIDIFTSDRQNTWVNVEGLAQHIVFPVFENFESVAEYSQNYFRIESSFQRLTGQNSYIAGGTALYYQSLSPNIRTDFSVRGHTTSHELFLRWNHNSLNRLAFPQSGTRFNINSTFFFNQKPSLRFNQPDGNVSSDLREAGIEISNYLQAAFNWESYIPVNHRLTSFNHLQAGYNFFYNQSFINMFNLGGTYPFLKNQVTFAGLNEYEVISHGVIKGTMGWQYNIWDEFLISPLFNAALYGFELEALQNLSSDNLLLGGGLSIGYLSGLGPMEVTFAWSPQNKKLLAYVNLGWTF